MEKKRSSTIKPEPLDVIRIDLDRIAVKRKEENEGFPVQLHPMKKEEKMLGTVGWVGSFDVAERNL